MLQGVACAEAGISAALKTLAAHMIAFHVQQATTEWRQAQMGDHADLR